MMLSQMTMTQPRYQPEDANLMDTDSLMMEAMLDEGMVDTSSSSDDEEGNSSSDDEEDEESSSSSSTTTTTTTTSASSTEEPMDDVIPIPLSMEGTTLHTERPFRGFPKGWPVHEVYALNIPVSHLQDSDGRSGLARTWGSCFKLNNKSAVASKRLLFLFLEANRGALASSTGNPKHSPPYGSTPRVVTSYQRVMDKELKKNPTGKVRRKQGIGGAVSPAKEDVEELLQDLEQCLSPRPEYGKILATPANTPGVFLYHDTEKQDDPILARRISLVLEELLSQKGGRTVAWRWWFYVHDPRIQLAQWLKHVMQESKTIKNTRQNRINSKASRGMQITRKDREPMGPVSESDCFRSIASVKDLELVLKDYYAGDNKLALTPTADANAMSSGITGPISAMHPTRVFAPQVALQTLYVAQVCGAQKNINNYFDPRTGLIGFSARCMRTTAYDAAVMKPDRLHQLEFASNLTRNHLVAKLMWQNLEQGKVPMPDSIADAVSQGNMSEAVRLCQDKGTWEAVGMNGAEAQKALSESVLEDAIESTEAADHEAQITARKNKRSRLAPASGFDSFGIQEDPEEPRQQRQQPAESDQDDQRSDDEEEAMEPEVAPAQAAATDPQQLGENMVDLALLSLLRTTETENGSALDIEDVRRSPYLAMRVQNNKILLQIQARFEAGSPMYQAAMGHYRSTRFDAFWRLTELHQDDPMKLSTPVREGTKFITAISRRPNLIKRHQQAAKSLWDVRRRAEGVRATFSVQERALVMSAMASNVSGASSRSALPTARRGHVLMSQTQLQNFWFEWGIGAMNLSAYGNWRINMHHKCVHFFRVRPSGAGLLHRLLLAQGIACTYLWGIHGDQLMWGPGGVGKSYMLHCVYKQGYSGQIEFHDNITEKSFAVDQDRNDVLILIEEMPARFVGQDEKGNPTAGDELLKTLLTRHQIVTVQCHKDEDGNRIMQKSTCRCMCLIFGATNLSIKMQKDGHKPALLTRFMMDYIGWGKHEVPLAAINSPMGPERDDPHAQQFFHQMSIVNALAMVVEKMIETKVLMDVDTDVCAFHFQSFFNAVHEKCHVPKIESRTLEMMTQLCRQTAIRYAIHRVFFSETAASEVRCELRSNVDVSDGRQRTALDWKARKFQPSMLLLVQPHLVVTEEMMADVLTTTRSTYMPTTRWGVLKTLMDVRKHSTTSLFRRVTKARLLLSQNERVKARSKRQPVPAPVIPTPISIPIPTVAAVVAPSNTVVSEFQAVMGDGTDITMSSSSSSSSTSVATENPAEVIVNDKNYHVFLYSDVWSACHQFSQASRGTIEAGIFFQALREMQREILSHADRNRPKAISEVRQHQADIDGIELAEEYDKTISSHVVLLEQKPAAAGIVVVNPNRNRGGRRRRGRPSNRSREAASGDGNGPLQICILIEYLEQRRNESIDKILLKQLSYAAARPRHIITGCSIFDKTKTKELKRNQVTVVAVEYLNVIKIEPKLGNIPSRSNHFVQSAVTDSFVYNDSLDESGTTAPSWGNYANDLRRHTQLFLRSELDQTTILAYWKRVGIDPSQAELPSAHTERLRDMVQSTFDGTGSKLPNRVKQNYPNDYFNPQRGASTSRGQEAEEEEELDIAEGEDPETGGDVRSWLMGDSIA